MADPQDTTNIDFGFSKKAEAQLSAIIGSSEEEREFKSAGPKQVVAPEESPPEVASREALVAEHILSTDSERDRARLLILTRDTAMAREKSLSQKRMLELGEVFAEIHVVVLAEEGIDASVQNRIASNVWVYTTRSTSWWRVGFDAYKLAKSQLLFAQGFRADIVIAEDPFESGVAGHFLAQKYNRPFQVHVFEDYYEPTFAEKNAHNGLRLFMARFTTRRADCIRTKSSFLKDRIIEYSPKLASYTEVLPMYHNLDAWRDASPAFDLHQRYPQFKFIVLHATAMSTKSRTDRVLTGMTRLLKQYSTVGLVVVGDGPEREMLQRHVTMLGIQSQVVFEDMPDDLSSHMKTANVLAHLSEDVEEDIFVLEAAASGLPIVTGIAGISAELFIDGQTAFVCPNDRPACVGERVNQYLNQNQLRTRLARAAQGMIFERIDQDYNAYLKAYRESIERCVVASG